MSIASGLADLAARKLTAAKVVYAKAVAGQAAGRSFTDAELEELTAALKLLNVPVSAADGDAALYAGYAALKAAVDALPTAERAAEMKAKLIEELTAAEGEMVVAMRTRQHSAQMLNDLQNLRVRVNNFGHEDDRLRRRLYDATDRLAPIFAVCPIAQPAPTPADDNPGPAKPARKATAAAK